MSLLDFQELELIPLIQESIISTSNNDILNENDTHEDNITLIIKGMREIIIREVVSLILPDLDYIMSYQCKLRDTIREELDISITMHRRVFE